MTFKCHSLISKGKTRFNVWTSNCLDLFFDSIFVQTQNIEKQKDAGGHDKKVKIFEEFT